MTVEQMITELMKCNPKSICYSLQNEGEEESLIVSEIIKCTRGNIPTILINSYKDEKEDDG